MITSENALMAIFGLWISRVAGCNRRTRFSLPADTQESCLALDSPVRRSMLWCALVRQTAGDGDEQTIQDQTDY